jgi:predicted lipoprotein with Yx(FWY)xxD motif
MMRTAARKAILALGLIVALIWVVQASAASATFAHSKRVAKETFSPALGEDVLANLKGRTLYSLSAERGSHFICTGGCLSLWHPLLIPHNTEPLGPVKLGVVTRPEGKVQVTYRGRPLYRFSGDAAPGDANGQGFKDVGTWRAAMPPSRHG